MPSADSKKSLTREQQAQATAVELLEAVIANHSSAEERPQQSEMARLVASAVDTLSLIHI